MPLELSRIRLICFDIDGTLSDTDNQMVSRFEKYLKPFRFLYPHRNTRSAARRLVMAMESPGNMLLTGMDTVQLDEISSSVVDFLCRHGIIHRAPSFWIIKGIEEMLAVLSASFPLAVVSARDATETMAFLHQYNLDGYFKLIVSSHTCPHTKPYPHPILHAAKEMGVQASEILMVGDTTVDIRSARSAGAQSIGVLCGFGDEAELRRAGADMILPRTNDILNLFTFKNG
jgi:phosphoglycolate phosphatase-like HAD superfamily hydrolase